MSPPPQALRRTDSPPAAGHDVVTRLGKPWLGGSTVARGVSKAAFRDGCQPSLLTRAWPNFSPVFRSWLDALGLGGQVAIGEAAVEPSHCHAHGPACST